MVEVVGLRLSHAQFEKLGLLSIYVFLRKWHLGHADKKYWPQNRGFDYFYGNLVGEVDYFTKERGGIIDWQRN